MVVIVLCLGFIGFVAYNGILHPTWAYNGAYLDYYGKAKLGNGNSYSYNINMTVLDGSIGGAQGYSRVTVWTRLTTPTGSLTNETTMIVGLKHKESNPFTLGNAISKSPATMSFQGKSVSGNVYYFDQGQFNLTSYNLFTNFTIFEMNAA